MAVVERRQEFGSRGKGIVQQMAVISGCFFLTPAPKHFHLSALFSFHLTFKTALEITLLGREGVWRKRSLRQ